MSKIKEAIKRKFPRYFIATGKGVDKYDVWVEGSHLCRGLAQSRAVANLMVKERNELIDKLIEATELLDQMAQAHIQGSGNESHNQEGLILWHKL